MVRWGRAGRAGVGRDGSAGRMVWPGRDGASPVSECQAVGRRGPGMGGWVGGPLSLASGPVWVLPSSAFQYLAEPYGSATVRDPGLGFRIYFGGAAGREGRWSVGGRVRVRWRVGRAAGC
jgi:hypothetical protein